MKSVKPGRGPSAMGAVGSVISVIFGIAWTAMAASMGAPAIFPVFGVLFIIIGIVQAIYNWKNATGKNRFSAFDITDSTEESDPMQELFGSPERGERSFAERERDSERRGRFCPYCGAAVQQDYTFCKECGKKLP